MTLSPRVDANHQTVLSVLAFLALDCPDFNDIIRSLVVELYGPKAAQVYDEQQRQFERQPTKAAGGRR